MPHSVILSKAFECIPTAGARLMINRDTKKPIAGPWDVSILALDLSRSPRRGAPGAVDNPSSSSSLIAGEILPNHPGSPLL